MTFDANEAVLPEDVLKIAKRELREDKSTRDQCLEQFRNWLMKNADVANVRTDDHFLLRFLRVKKFSVPMAEQTLLKYLNLRRTFPHVSTQLDYLDERVNEIITSGYIFASPKRDRHGRRVVIVNGSGLNPKRYDSSDQAKAHFLTYEYLMEDAQTQVVGITHVGDFNGVTTAHITKWNPTEFGRIFRWGEQSVPLRHKEIHIVNAPSTLKFLIDIVKNIASAKMRNRLCTHTNFKELCKFVDPECLPQEYGGSMPMKEMIELWKEELAQKRDILLATDQMKLLSDRGIQRKSSYNVEKTSGQTTFVSQMESIQGSFRKLEFD